MKNQMEHDIESFMELYDSSPSLVLFENLLGSDYFGKEGVMSKITQSDEGKKLNPIEVVLESLINIVSEDISSKIVTHSQDKVLINNDIRKRAVKIITKFINTDRRRLERLHKAWLDKLTAFLKHAYEGKRKPRIDEIIFLVGNEFRISASSAIKALVSISKKKTLACSL